MYEIVYSKLAVKQIKKLKEANLFKKFEWILNIIKSDPYQTPPAYEKLSGGLKDTYSRRINIKHRLVYKIKSGKAYILSLWSHYEEI